MTMTWQELLQRLDEQRQQLEKFDQVETRILATLDFHAFFATLLAQIEGVFGIPLVWCVLRQDSTPQQLLAELPPPEGSAWAQRLVLADSCLLDQLLPPAAAVVLADRGLERYRPLLPAGVPLPGSLALAPIRLDGVLVGLLALADNDPARFAPELDPQLLDRLALKISLCLSNVTAHERLRQQARRDPLTGLLNRRALDMALEQEFQRASRYHTVLTLVFVDLNDFKQVNDRYGHSCGDALLQWVAQVLRDCSRQSDYVGRYAGDEFLLLLPQTSRSQAYGLMQRAEARLRQQPLRLAGTELAVSFSFGLADGPSPAIATAADLVRLADADQYRCKQAYHGRAPLPSADQGPSLCM